MTYCVAAMIDAGIVLASDSRTNAGVDNISTFRKMHTYQNAGERVLVSMCSGNLAVTQSMYNLIDQAIRRNDGSPSIMNVYSMYEVAELFGAALREVRLRDGPFLQESNIDVGANVIVGGQIAGEEQRLFMVYSEGNFIEATPSTPYFQIGEMKYGKPIIDRVITAETTLDDAVKCMLVSFDSTMRSNLTVGFPIDMACYERNSLVLRMVRCFEEDDEYIRALRNDWNEGVRQAFVHLPSPNWNQWG